MFYPDEECARPYIFVDWQKVAAGMDTGYAWVGLVAGYLGALLTILLILLVCRLFDEWRNRG